MYHCVYILLLTNENNIRLNNFGIILYKPALHQANNTFMRNALHPRDKGMIMVLQFAHCHIFSHI